MIPFAVHVNGEPKDKGYWVLAVDGERLLLANNDRTFRWVELTDCTFLKAATPDTPRLVAVVQPQRPGIEVPNLRINNGKN